MYNIVLNKIFMEYTVWKNIVVIHKFVNFSLSNLGYVYSVVESLAAALIIIVI